MFYIRGEENRGAVMVKEVDETDILGELDNKLSLLLANRSAIEAKLRGNGLSPDRRKGLEFQLGCLIKPIERIRAQIQERMG